MLLKFEFPRSVTLFDFFLGLNLLRYGNENDFNTSDSVVRGLCHTCPNLSVKRYFVDPVRLLFSFWSPMLLFHTVSLECFITL